MFRSSDRLQGATLFLAKDTFLKTLSVFKKSSLKTILGSKHVGAILNVLV